MSCGDSLDPPEHVVQKDKDRNANLSTKRHVATFRRRGRWCVVIEMPAGFFSRFFLALATDNRMPRPGQQSTINAPGAQ